MNANEARENARQYVPPQPPKLLDIIDRQIGLSSKKGEYQLRFDVPSVYVGEDAAVVVFILRQRGFSAKLKHGNGWREPGDTYINISWV